MASDMPRYSILEPLAVERRAQIVATAAIFFSGTYFDEACEVLGKEKPKGQITAFSGAEFLKFLEMKGFIQEANRFIFPVKALLDAMERAGFLTAVGTGKDVLLPKHYFCFKELTKLEAAGKFWLAPVLGPEFIHYMYAPYIAHIVGVGKKDGAEHAGSGLVISDRHVLTCGHVISDMEIQKFQRVQGKSVEVLRTQAHERIDVGVIEFGPGALRAAPGLSFRSPLLMEKIAVIGYPRVPLAQEAPLIVQSGEVTCESVRTFFEEEVFLYSAVARPGNSGGPIISIGGYVVGIVTQDLSDQGVSHAPFFAGIATKTIQDALDEMSIGVQIPIENFA